MIIGCRWSASDTPWARTSIPSTMRSFSFLSRANLDKSKTGSAAAAPKIIDPEILRNSVKTIDPIVTVPDVSISNAAVPTNIAHADTARTLSSATTLSNVLVRGPFALLSDMMARVTPGAVANDIPPRMSPIEIIDSKLFESSGSTSGPTSKTSTRTKVKARAPSHSIIRKMFLNKPLSADNGRLPPIV